MGLTNYKAFAHGAQVTMPQCPNGRHLGCDPELTHTKVKPNQSTPQQDANSAHPPHVLLPGRKRDVHAPTGLRRFYSAYKRTHSTVGRTHSTVGPGPQYCGSRPTVLWCNQSDPTGTHTNTRCSHSTRGRCSNIAHVGHRQHSGRVRGIQVSTSG